ncbi:MAG TPA: DUF2961 domain-containing protein [Armatimonadota bacterium]|jgi:hypothetical protein
MRNWKLIVAAGLMAGAMQAAGAAPILGSSLSDLAAPRAGRTAHEGSWDRSGGNGDLRPVDPGQTITLFDHNGAGIVRRFWVTIAPRATEEIHSQAILRMYWDGEESPSVEAPIGAFFGVGFGQQVDYQSMPLNETSGGYNCYWPMPFHKSARWTITNLSKRRIDAFYYNIDYTAMDSLPKDLRHFHAQFRRENPTTANKNYTILDAEGAGHFVGTALFMQNRQGRGLGFLEGDEMVYVDGEETPSVNGTGTEDYFSSGWYFDRGTYSANYHGVPIKDEKLGRVSAYRWHIEDAMPFAKSIRVTIEHGHANDHVADYSSVAYWYQTEPHKAFAALPPAEALLPLVPPAPMKIPGAIEGEDLLPFAKATEGEVSEQTMEGWPGQWSNGSQLWWLPSKAGTSLTITAPAPAAGDFDVTGYFTKAKDYGTFRVLVNGKALDAPLNLYNADVTASGPVSLGRVTLTAGPNTVLVQCTGKDARSEGYLFGLDAIVLKPAS